MQGLNSAEGRIIPTRNKNRVPRALSYPIGAEAISKALADVPQFDELSLEFRFWNRPARLYGTATPYPATSYPVLEAQYHGPLRYLSATPRTEDYHFPRWTISVDAVPRSLRHQIQGMIVNVALPSVKSWLLANPYSDEREGCHGLTFSFDELKGELACEEHASVESRTGRPDRPRRLLK